MYCIVPAFDKNENKNVIIHPFGQNLLDCYATMFQWYTLKSLDKDFIIATANFFHNKYGTCIQKCVFDEVKKVFLKNGIEIGSPFLCDENDSNKVLFMIDCFKLKKEIWF